MTNWGNMETSSEKICFPIAGIVTNGNDPEGLGRIKVKFPALGDNESNWARVCTWMGGNNKGAYFLPEVGEEVLVIFEMGDISKPCILSSLWNGKDKPPVKKQDKNNTKMIKFRSGFTIEIFEEEGKEKILIYDKSQKNKIAINLEEKKISIESEKDISITAKENLFLEAKQIQIKSKEETKIDAKEMNLKASGNIKAKSGGKIYLN